MVQMVHTTHLAPVKLLGFVVGEGLVDFPVDEEHYQGRHKKAAGGAGYGSIFQGFDGFILLWLDGSMFLWFIGSMVLCFNG